MQTIGDARKHSRFATRGRETVERHWVHHPPQSFFFFRKMPSLRDLVKTFGSVLCDSQPYRVAETQRPDPNNLIVPRLRRTHLSSDMGRFWPQIPFKNHDLLPAYRIVYDTPSIPYFRSVAQLNRSHSVYRSQLELVRLFSFIR